MNVEMFFVMEINELAQIFLSEVKQNHGIKSYVHALKTIDSQNLRNSLRTEAQKKAFWINIYNAFLQIRLKMNPSLYKNRKKLFTTKDIIIAQELLSLDDIEHGILRGSLWKYSFGYLKKIIITPFEKQFRVQNIDPRIHFALNCGAKSCPPIRNYNAENIEHQLNIATESFLENEVNYDVTKKELQLSRLFLWYQGDFGGKKGAILFLQKFGYPISKHVRLKYMSYDWTLQLNNYKT